MVCIPLAEQALILHVNETSLRNDARRKLATTCRNGNQLTEMTFILLVVKESTWIRVYRNYIRTSMAQLPFFWQKTQENFKIKVMWNIKYSQRLTNQEPASVCQYLLIYLTAALNNLSVMHLSLSVQIKPQNNRNKETEKGPWTILKRSVSFRSFC